MRTALCSLLLLATWPVTASNTANAIFHPALRTLKVQRTDDFEAPPIITLGQQQKLAITFDSMTEDRDFLRYRLIHCNADWQPSQLMESEYLDTFNDIPIDDFAFSQNTFIHYVNYRIEIGEDTILPTQSGNYLLQVYDEDDPETTLLQARFCVEDASVQVDAAASAKTDRGVNDTYQQLDITVDKHRLDLRDPFNEVKVVVEQNYSPYQSVTVTHPQRVEADRIIYEHLPQLIFRAGNEYRRFETVRADYPGMNVDSVKYIGPDYHAWLRPDVPGRDHVYIYDRTQHGRYMVREYNATDSDLGADYVTVHFTLPSPQLIDADVYVDGEATLGNFSETNRMVYDHTRQAYTLSIPLKQGSYNYRYVVLQPGGNPDPYFMDGDHYETANEYTVKVYVRRPGDRYDRLVGYTTTLNR